MATKRSTSKKAVAPDVLSEAGRILKRANVKDAIEAVSETDFLDDTEEIVIVAVRRSQKPPVFIIGSEHSDFALLGLLDAGATLMQGTIQERNMDDDGEEV